MRKLNRLGQNIIEYVLVIGFVGAVLMSLYAYLNYLAQGRLEVVSDYVTEEDN